ncbi:MAG: DUF924 domain-containing protein [Sulfuritalea sp.]|nr:DUF924 domain-containing protein [Sulfuritalea sp.]
MASDSSTRAILDFWFLPEDHSDHGKDRAEWFRKNDAFDDEIRQRFGTDIETALGSSSKEGSAEALLARILLLDQFTRNTFRNTLRAFAGDSQALEIAKLLVSSGRDKNLTPFQRWFAYLPFEHSESLLDQERAVALYDGLRREMQNETFDGAYDYALKHRAIIVRFGRFPHRNAILGRDSTAEEIEFLKQPGSSF